MSLKPFFINYATEEKMSLCLCKLCLNTPLIFDTMMAGKKRSGGSIFTSITQFFSNDCDCPVSSNGFLSWSFVNGKCKEYKFSVHSFITADANFGHYSQFEQTKTPYYIIKEVKLLRKHKERQREYTIQQHLKK